MADITPRVNSARLGDFIGRTVRLVCKVEHAKDLSVIVRATDMGQVEVKMSMPGQIDDTYAEVIGVVEDANVVKLQAAVNLGSDLDMEVINECIEMTYDPRFSKYFWDA